LWPLLKLFDGFRCRLAGTLVGALCQIGVPDPQGKGRFGGRTSNQTAKPWVLCCCLTNTNEDIGGRRFRLLTNYFWSLLLLWLCLRFHSNCARVYSVCFFSAGCFLMCIASSIDPLFYSFLFVDFSVDHLGTFQSMTRLRDMMWSVTVHIRKEQDKYFDELVVSIRVQTPGYVRYPKKAGGFFSGTCYTHLKNQPQKTHTSTLT